MKIRKIYACWVYVSDMEQSVRFYRDIGFTVKFVEDDGVWVEFDLGETSFALLQRPAEKGKVQPRKTRIMFEVSHIEKMQEHLISLGVRLIGGIREEPYGKLLTFEDPDGHWLEFFENNPKPNTQSPKPKYNPDKHHRRSIRLCGYDYAQEGLYFVTICCQDRMCLFGEIVNGEMVLNDAGRMVEKWYYKTAEKFSHIRCLDMVVMPNHFHCIWQIENDFTVTNVGANPCVRPDDNTPCVRPIIKQNEQTGRHMGEQPSRHVGEQTGRHVGLPLHRVVQWFKTMTTNEYIRGVEKYDWIPFNRKLWQRNYYEHIIRNAESYANIAEYITNNPASWQNDIFFIK